LLIIVKLEVIEQLLLIVKMRLLLLDVEI